jgi:hypothetical protein
MNTKGNTETHAIEVSKRCCHPIYLLRKLASHGKIKYHQLIQFCTALIESSVLYASEAWGAFIPWNFGSWDRSLFERANFKSCKAILQVSPATDNIGARSEVGRLPLLYNIQKRSIRYWASISKRPDSIISRLLSDESYKGIGIQEKMGSGAMNGCNLAKVSKATITHRHNFMTQYETYWRQRVETSTKLSHFYYSFKMTHNPEKYLFNLPDPQSRRLFAAFRLGNHKLAVETQRYVRPKIPYEERKCQICQAEVENEIHFLFKCSGQGYKRARDEFVDSVAQSVKNFDLLSAVDKGFYLMTQEDPEITKKVIQFIREMTVFREQQLH